MTDNEIIKALEWLEETMGVCSSDDEYIYGQIILDLINRQKAEIERLTAQRDKAVKDFEEFARIAFEIPFACKHCVHSVENGRACLWKEEHEDEEETCLGKHFEYRKVVGKNND